MRIADGRGIGSSQTQSVRLPPAATLVCFPSMSTSLVDHICVTCGTQFSATEGPPLECPICLDERQYVGPDGQQWTTLLSCGSAIGRTSFVSRNRISSARRQTCQFTGHSCPSGQSNKRQARSSTPGLSKGALTSAFSRATRSTWNGRRNPDKRRVFQRLIGSSFFSLEEARRKLNPAQIVLLDRLSYLLADGDQALAM
ncbi:MAG: hypothetical protein QOE70_2500 [Chthoniobacter sp.]|nr:hypothetical protein [Chthoniobacter sp.]